MECIKCGKYYPDEKRVCPFCNYAMTREERKAYKADLKIRMEEMRRKDKEKRKQPKTPEEIERERRYREVCKKLEKERRGEFLAKPGIYEDSRVVSVVLVSTQDETQTKKGAGKALLGGALFGPAGLLIGAATAKSKTKVVGQKATFSVKYASGRVATETVPVGGQRFKELSALLHK